MSRSNYGSAIREGFVYLLENHPEVFVMGQGLWAKWYVGESMTDLDKIFGKERVMDSPVSELACTGAAVGASLCGYRSVVVHPRMDFMLYAVDAIVNQAAKWSHMFGGQACVPVTVRAIVNRGGAQGAQHSQALHAWFARVPGLRVVMPATSADARDLLISSVLCDDPVLYIDDRWLYDWEGDLAPISVRPLEEEGPRVLREGHDVTVVGLSYSTRLCLDSCVELESRGISAEIVDLRVINPLDTQVVLDSVCKTGRLLVVDGEWKTCGLAGEMIAQLAEVAGPGVFTRPPRRLTLADAPAPCSTPLEQAYYSTTREIVSAIQELVDG